MGKINNKIQNNNIDINADGSISLISSNSSDVIFNSSSENVRPILDNTGNIGTPSFKWNNLYVNNIINDDLSFVKDAIIDSKTVSGFVDPENVDLSFNDSTRTLTVSTTSSYSFYEVDTKYTKTSDETLVISDTTGQHYIYFENGSLTETVDPDNDTFVNLIINKALVSIIYWNSTHSELVYFGKETHGLMDVYSRIQSHFHDRAVYISGLGLTNFSVDGSGDLDIHAQYSVSSGSILDEDLFIDIINNTPQSLSPLNAPVLYREGSSWRRSTPSTEPWLTTGSGRTAWNQNIGGSWQQTEVDNNDLVIYHVVATNDTQYPIQVIQGQNEYNKIQDARQAADNEINSLILNGLPIQEFIFIGSVIGETNNNYSNSVQTAIRSTDTGADYIDWRNQEFTPGGIPSPFDQDLNTVNSVQFDGITSTSDIIPLNTGTNGLGNFNYKWDYCYSEFVDCDVLLASANQPGDYGYIGIGSFDSDNNDAGSILDFRSSHDDPNNTTLNGYRFQVDGPFGNDFRLIRFDNSTTGNDVLKIEQTSNNINFYGDLLPENDDTNDVGSSSQRWDDIYATNGTIQTSDLNQKHTVRRCDLGLKFINHLKPISFIRNGGQRRHYGLGAQHVKKALRWSHKDTNDFAGYIYDEVNDIRGLRYDEFIAPMIKSIQELSQENDELKKRIEKLEKKLK